jgi:hypothetical protein
VTTRNGSDRFVVDSIGWVEFLGNGPKSDAFAKYFEHPQSVLLPTIIVYEVYYKKILREQVKPWRSAFCPTLTDSANAKYPSTSRSPLCRQNELGCESPHGRRDHLRYRQVP